MTIPCRLITPFGKKFFADITCAYYKILRNNYIMVI